ncbi:hypothetical protein BGZ61DRAFT_545785 [Ilyonectria robusta]|uniref:uncharacterized protein n=1 Tax=Ilyonectria robusta TaxID=1079257 RepID=UPI001E8EB9BE|nr:uncharacterized protein BGZ61DRAFT_545785 [Ilyonectria robusta]KAH8650430.1 hypothetical protein BGZ61DRAFT_545785 [Ilyonectria robusta]
MPAKLEDVQKDAIASIASVSTLLRNAIAAALPVAPEQYLTVAIPGTVIDLADYDKGGSFVYDAKYTTTPTTVRQSEASLVDGMMPVATIMIGNTGKSVARSYSRSLDALLPAKATISSADGIRSPGNPNYDKAMNFLKTAAPGSTRTVVEVYRDKQMAWAKERSAWDTAKIDAAKRAAEMYPPGSGPDFIGKQKQYLNDWNQQNYFTFKASIQAAWMDWVVNGQKYDVDFNFGMIDIDSIMSRIESSKESLRNSTIPDANGAAEVYGVSLTPRRWATYCKRKAEGWYERNGSYTLAQLDREIARLENPWTTITFSYSASDVSNHSKESEWGMKVGGSVGFGLWSVGGSYSHDESHKSMQSDMAACDVSVSFSALVVNINRPWLYGELFSDVDLEVAEGVKLSPGPLLLQQMIKDQKAEDIAMWSQFPSYPTSFIVAADTTIEFRGATKHIEEHFDSHSNSGGASVGYGPWSVTSSFHESATEQSMQVHSTATGCKISFGAPQVIAWVSQILPPLPRDQSFNPLTQGGGIPVPSGSV